MRVWSVWALVAWPVALGAIALGMVLVGTPEAVAQVPWPTPPPAPVGFFPQVIPSSQIKPVQALVTPGSIAVQVDPIFAGPVPRVPPRASTVIVSGEATSLDRVTLQIDAGALDQTLQLTYEPTDSVPEIGPGRQLQRAFWIRMYDYNGSPVIPTFKYPIRLNLTVSDEELAASGGDPARLLLARYDTTADRWVALVTTYKSADSSLLVRILQPGLFALIAEPSPVSP